MDKLSKSATVGQHAAGVRWDENEPDTPTDALSASNNSVGSQVQRQRIIFLENNLDQLTKVHKSLAHIWTKNLIFQLSSAQL